MGRGRMELLIAIGSGFGLALVSPWLVRALGRPAAWLCALLPLALTIYFAQFLAGFPDDAPLEFRYDWVPDLGLSLTLYLDGLGLLFALLISGIGALVVIYASGYLHDMEKLGPFLTYTLAFMASMLGLVVAGNLLLVYVFWEFTTITSFLLIGLEHKREAARSAALQALIVTTIGSLAMLAGLILLGQVAGTYQMRELLSLGETVRSDPRYLGVLILILMGALTKSAQFPFHFWLPGAMQAPTPVSAYLHSATMVKAGVFLMARFMPVLGHTDEWTIILTTLGGVTMLTGAWLAFFDTDLKGILAYLTVCVLGTLTMLLGIGTELAVKGAMIYLLAHALYKAALFLLVGAVDHQTGTRELGQLNGLRRTMPLTGILVLVSWLSMAGVAPLVGFVGKEVFLDAVWGAPRSAIFLTIAAVISSMLITASAGLVGIGPFLGSISPAAEKAREAPMLLWIGPLILATGSLMMGFAPQWLATPLIEPAVSAVYQTPTPVKLQLWHGWNVPLALSILALIGGLALYAQRQQVWQLAAPWKIGSVLGPTVWYQRGMEGLLAGAAGLTRFLQHGYLRIYVLVAVATMVVAVGAGLWRTTFSLVPQQQLGVHFHEVVAALLILLAALTAVRANKRFQAVAALGVIGFNVAWIFILFGAPDLAMTQFVVETLLVLIFVFAFYRLPEMKIHSSRPTMLRDAVLSIGAGCMVTVLLLIVISTPHATSISTYFVDNSVPLAHGHNVVNVILVDFRALDTLGEIAVLTIAGVGVAVLMRLVIGGQRET